MPYQRKIVKVKRYEWKNTLTDIGKKRLRIRYEEEVSKRQKQLGYCRSYGKGNNNCTKSSVIG